MNVKYEADGLNAIWPLPESCARPLVSVCGLDGLERRQRPGQDYYVKDGAVVMAVEAGCLVLIRDGGAARPPAPAPLSDAEGLAERLSRLERLAAAPVASQAYSPAASQPAALAADAGELADIRARLDRLDAERDRALMEAREAAADGQIARIAESGEEAALKIGEARAAGLAEAEADIAGARERALADIGEAADAAARSAGARVLEAGEAARLALERASQAEKTAAQALAELEAARRELSEAAKAASRELESGAEAASNNIKSSAALAMDNVRGEGARAMEAARRNGQLPGQAWPRGAVISQGADMPAGARLDLPLVYWPGRDALRVSRNGDVLACGIDYEEAAPAGEEPASHIILLKASPACAVWTFWTPPINAAQAADAAAAKAMEAARFVARAESRIGEAGQDLKRAALDAREAAREGLAEIRQTEDRAARRMGEAAAKTEARLDYLANDLARGVAKEADRACCSAGNSQAAAQSAHANALEAWEAAWQSSIAAARPGIAAARELAEILRCPSGLYIINPHILRSPTIFMGMWPVEKAEDIGWDGIFFFGQPWDDQPRLPPKPPAPPEPEPCEPIAPPRQGAGWLPCGHGHQDKA